MFWKGERADGRAKGLGGSGGVDDKGVVVLLCCLAD